MKKFIKPLALVLAILLITSSVSAAEPASTGDCPHINSEYRGTDTSYRSVGSEGHYFIITRHFHCLDCGSYYDIITNKDYVNHSFSKDYLIEQYHQGHYHYYVYFGSCACGETKIIYDDPELCPGPPCNIHM